MLIERPLLAVLPDTATARVVGRHRARFLHAMTTADVAKMAPGASAFALMATSTGRHVGQMRLEVEADAIVLSGRRDSLGAILDALKKHRVADDVRWELEAETATLAVYGTTGIAGTKDSGAAPRDAGVASEAVGAVRALVARVLGKASEVGLSTFEDCAFEDAMVRVTAIPAENSELGREVLHLRIRADLAPHLRVRLLAAGAEPLDEATWERLRIEAGWPLDGLDVGEDDVALASERLGGTVSWNKGCFLGQEVYVMARDRGELPKRLRSVRIDAGETPGRVELRDGEGKVAGLLGSAVETPAGFLALAMMKRKHSEPGTELHLPDGRRVEVLAPPLR